jgi:hypothetical protein
MTQLEDDRAAGLVASAMLHVIMDRVANQGVPFDRRTATKRLLVLANLERLQPRAIAALPDAKLAEWWEVNVARPIRRGV